MKNTFIGLIFLSLTWLSSCGNSASTENKPESAAPLVSSEQIKSTTGDQTASPVVPGNESGAVVQLTKAMFLEKVYDFEKNPKHWSFAGDKPCIIDFYADWCRPCKMVAPIMSELAEKYKGQITIYKVNTDQERELAQFFNIRSIPTMFFCPAKGDPQLTQGALAKEEYEKLINEFLLKK
ncbi:MAG: thioredoxin [Bacteroidales bacterium]